MIEAKQIECGQRRRYGDFYRVWEIQTDENEETVKEWCFENLCERRVPQEAEWRKNIRIDGEKHGDYRYYFNGYYNFEKMPNGYKFTICDPYAD